MKPITLNDAIVSYGINVLANHQQSTRRHHDNELERWRVWITGKTQPDVFITDLDHNMMAEYFNRLRPPAYRETTFNNYRQYNVAFWQYCMSEGWVRVSPMRYITAMKVPKRARLRLSASELEQMLDLAKSPRDRCLVAVAMHTGLRNQDLAALTVGDVNLHDNTLSAYISKKKATDEFKIPPELREELLEWYDAYARVAGFSSWRQLPNSYRLLPTFAGRFGTGGTMQTVIKPYAKFRHPEQIIQGILVEMGFELHDADSQYRRKSNNLGLHTVRRSMARVIHDQAAADGRPNPIRIAMTQLGHESQKTTEIYIGVDKDKTERDEMAAGGFMRRAAEREQGIADTIDDVTPIARKEKRRYA